MGNKQYNEHLWERYFKFLDEEERCAMDYKLECGKIANWMKEYIKNTNTKGFVVGLSGGIDSAVVASLAVEAVGPDNVIGVSMPCYSSEGSISDAELLAKNLGIRLISANLERAFEAIREPLKSGEPISNRKISDGNIKARLRMIKLYEVANLNNLIVAGTSNLTEMMIGYFTKYGDGGVDIEPIAQYYKWEVYNLAKHLPAIPVTTVLKKPSADLWRGQTDEQEIGMTYAELDDILQILEKDPTIEMPLEPGERRFSIGYYGLIDSVRNKIKISEHKRNAPPQYNR